MMRCRPALFAVLTLGSASGCAWIGDLGQFNGAVEAEAGSRALVADSGLADDAIRIGDAERPGADASQERLEDADALPGAGDASAADGGDAASWCEANATPDTAFCRDFDDGMPYGYGFSTDFNLADGGQVPGLVSSDFVSSPNSLLITTPAMGAADVENVRLTVPVTDHKRIQLKFALKLVDYDVGVGSLSLSQISFNSSNWRVSWDLQETASVHETLVSPDGGLTTFTHPTTMPPLGQWVDVVWILDIKAETISLTLDGTSALKGPISAPALAGGLSAAIGINELEGPAQPMSIYYDNVAIVTN